MSDLPTQTRVVIIGGGAVGASCAYHIWRVRDGPTASCWKRTS